MMLNTIPAPPPLPTPPKPFCLPPELMEDDEFTEKRHQKELQFRLVGAVERGDTTLLQELIDKGVNTNATIQLVKTPLTLALDQSEVFCDIVAILLNAKDTDPNLSDHTPWGLRPLHFVARNGNLELAKLFLEGCKANVCDINGKDKGGASPIHFAARFGHYEVVQYLVERSVDLLVADNSGRTALHRACECQHIEIAKFLINSGIDVNITDNFGWTPLFHSVFFCNTYVVEFLLQNNARTDLLDINGKSLLDLACYNNINYQHMGNYLQKVALATSFNFYERSRSIPSEQLLDLIYDLEQRYNREDHESFHCVKMLLNAGVDPKLYLSHQRAVHTFGVEAKIRAYLILAGAMLNPEDISFTDNKELLHRQKVWFIHQLEEQLSLVRQCRYRIRRCLAHSRDIDKNIDFLPLPKGLKNKLKLDSDFEVYMDTAKQ